MLTQVDVKWQAQAPLDNSSDAAGGIGRMTPATLLLHDERVCDVQLPRLQKREIFEENNELDPRVRQVFLYF